MIAPATFLCCFFPGTLQMACNHSETPHFLKGENNRVQLKIMYNFIPNGLREITLSENMIVSFGLAIAQGAVGESMANPFLAGYYQWALSPVSPTKQRISIWVQLRLAKWLTHETEGMLLGIALHKSRQPSSHRLLSISRRWSLFIIKLNLRES
jgi:hypothetical protein